MQEQVYKGHLLPNVERVKCLRDSPILLPPPQRGCCASMYRCLLVGMGRAEYRKILAKPSQTTSKVPKLLSKLWIQWLFLWTAGSLESGEFYLARASPVSILFSFCRPQPASPTHSSPLATRRAQGEHKGCLCNPKCYNSAVAIIKDSLQPDGKIKCQHWNAWRSLDSIT